MGITGKLIEQAKNPKGFAGKTMLKIMNSAHSSIMAWGLSKIHIYDNSIALDIGCGGGKTIRMLLERIKNGTVYGLDYSAEAVGLSLHENKEAAQNGRVIVKQGSVSSLPFPEDRFDIVTAFQTHYFWPDLKNDVAEIYRVLKKGGQFLLAAELYKINYHMKEYKTRESMKKLLEDCGFININIFETKQNICFVGEKATTLL